MRPRPLFQTSLQSIKKRSREDRATSRRFCCESPVLTTSFWIRPAADTKIPEAL